ncbi:hypothetical protein [Yellowstone lake phycodnavirus 2]|uniref:hypothetical protein n=1 Tax=Yellowstone lake phycodnavirus 2 TaxID=1586714 RepID=UPI0006EBE001|nr:hypothetical protein AR678_gp103 [Yellowstone lake phycodnavirus 2]BAT22377.1 hypothetical protein [Yellowstone lake phycodnavirus 2]
MVRVLVLCAKSREFNPHREQHRCPSLVQGEICWCFHHTGSNPVRCIFRLCSTIG